MLIAAHLSIVQLELSLFVPCQCLACINSLTLLYATIRFLLDCNKIICSYISRCLRPYQNLNHNPIFIKFIFSLKVLIYIQRSSKRESLCNTYFYRLGRRQTQGSPRAAYTQATPLGSGALFFHIMSPAPALVSVHFYKLIFLIVCCASSWMENAIYQVHKTKRISQTYLIRIMLWFFTISAPTMRTLAKNNKHRFRRFGAQFLAPT